LLLCSSYLPLGVPNELYLQAIILQGLKELDLIRLSSAAFCSFARALDSTCPAACFLDFVARCSGVISFLTFTKIVGMAAEA
jgi:hypothetical protein